MPKTESKTEAGLASGFVELAEAAGVEKPKSHRHFATHPKAGPGRGKKKGLEAVSIDLVSDMEKAYSTPESPTDSPLVKSLRQMVHDDPKKFIDQYSRLKGAVVAEPEAVEEELAAAAGPKELAVEELANRLLAEWEQEG